MPVKGDRRRFLQSLALLWPLKSGEPADPVLDVRPSPLYLQPDGRRNLIRISIRGLNAPAARARVLDRRGALAGTAGLLPTGDGLALRGEVAVPLAEPTQFQVDVEVGRDRVARRRVRLVPPKRWTLYLMSSVHTAVGFTDLQERALETHRRNLDRAVSRSTKGSDFRWTAECALQVLSFIENRGEEAAEALIAAIREGKVAFHAMFANLLTGLLDHDTMARVVWPAALIAHERGVTYSTAQITDVPGQTLTLPMALAASGVRYLITAADAERAVPLLSGGQAERYGIRGEWTSYPQLHWWEAPDGSRVLHWRGGPWGDAARFGFASGVAEMAARLAEWLETDPLLRSPGWPYDLALICGIDGRPNLAFDERVVAHVEEFTSRYAFPRIVPGRAEDFFRDLERKYAARIPVRRGDTGLYREDGAGAAAAALAHFRRAQLEARAAELLALWDERLPPGADADRAERRGLWRDLLLFGEHTFGAAESVSDPGSRSTVAQWSYKLRFLEGARAAAAQAVRHRLRRIGTSTEAGPGRLVFNASSWDRTDVLVIAGGAGRVFSHGSQDLPSVDLPDGSCLALVRDVPALGYVALKERDRPPAVPVDEGSALTAEAGGFRVRLDAGSGAIASFIGPDGRERVRSSPLSGLNQLIALTGGERSSMWTSSDRRELRNPPALETAHAELIAARRQRLPGIGVRLIAERRLPGYRAAASVVTLFDELPWMDVENRLDKLPTVGKEALYAAFPFAIDRPAVEIEVPLGRMTVERDQQPGSCRDWFCHAHWVWLRGAADGVVWSGPDTPLVTLNDVFRGEWRRRIEPDGTLFAYILNNYWHTNFPAGQDGVLGARFRVSLLAPGDAAEPVRRGWAACDPLYVGDPYVNASSGPLVSRDRAVALSDRNALLIAAKRADIGDGAIVRVLEVGGSARSLTVWPAAYRFRHARRTNLVEHDDGATISASGGAPVELRAWGLASARLFTSREGAG